MVDIWKFKIHKVKNHHLHVAGSDCIRPMLFVYLEGHRPMFYSLLIASAYAWTHLLKSVIIFIC